MSDIVANALPPATFTLESVDTSHVGKPPAVAFEFSADKQSMHAEPPDAVIRLDRVLALNGTARTRVRLWDKTLGDGEVTVDAVLDHRHAEQSAHTDWHNATAYACEIACALYWSQWRMQQCRASRLAEAQP